MKPSLLSTSSTRSRCLEPGIETFDLLRICALRMRAIMSPIGSFTAIATSSPARLHEARDEPLGAEVAQRDAAEFMLAVIGARTARQFAAVADTRCRRIARQFSELEGGGKPLLHGQLLVAGDRLERNAAVGVTLRHLAPPVILLDHTLLGHAFSSLFPRLRKRPSLP